MSESIKKNKEVDFNPNIKSFKTEHGSIYEKDADGRFRRHKYDGTEYEPQEFTLFLDEKNGMELERHERVSRAARYFNKDNLDGHIMYQLFGGLSSDEDLHVIFGRADAEKCDEYFLVLLRIKNNGQDIEDAGMLPVNLEPSVGSTVMELNKIRQDVAGVADSWHLGDRVTEVTRGEKEETGVSVNNSAGERIVELTRKLEDRE